MNKQTTRINGHNYTRYSNNEFWQADDERIIPGVICLCGNSTFEISYGNYECIANCTKCKASDVIYDG